MASPSLDNLTPREREILTLIAEGDSLAEIAQKLSRSLKTIESHRLSIGRKLKASNRVELAKIAISHGLVTIDVSQQQATGTTNLALEQSWIDQINTAIGKNTSRSLLQKFCEAASVLPTVSSAAICTTDNAFDQPDDQYRRIIKATSTGGEPGQVRRFHASGTACKILVDEGEHIIQKGASKAYPDDPWIQQIQAESYLGLSITDSQGEVIGGVVLVGHEPMKETPSLRRAVEFFVPRIAGALQACIDYDALLSRHDELVAKQTGKGTTPRGENGLSLFEQLSDRVDSATGARFLRTITDTLCELGGVQFAGICKLDDARAARALTTVILRTHGQVDGNVTYDITGSPCELVLDHGQYFIEDGATKTFPTDKLLVESNIESYLGLRVTSPEGKAIGTFWIADSKPIKNGPELLRIARHYAQRIGGELDQHLRLEQLTQDRERLENELAQKKKRHAKASA